MATSNKLAQSIGLNGELVAVTSTTQIVTDQLSGNIQAYGNKFYLNNVAVATILDVSANVALAVNALVAGAPGALDTLNELSAALNNDSNVYNTLMGQINKKVSSGTDTSFNVLTSTTLKIKGRDTAGDYIWASEDVPGSVPTVDKLVLKKGTSALMEISNEGALGNVGTDKVTFTLPVVMNSNLTLTGTNGATLLLTQSKVDRLITLLNGY